MVDAFHLILGRCCGWRAYYWDIFVSYGPCLFYGPDPVLFWGFLVLNLIQLPAASFSLDFWCPRFWRIERVLLRLKGFAESWPIWFDEQVREIVDGHSKKVAANLDWLASDGHRQRIDDKSQVWHYCRWCWLVFSNLFPPLTSPLSLVHAIGQLSANLLE